MIYIARHVDRARGRGGRLVSDGRILILLLLFIALSVLIIGRIVQISLSDHSVSRDKITQNVARGDIVDRDGVLLARTITVWSVGVHPLAIIGDRRSLAKRIAQVDRELGTAEDVYRKISRKVSFTYLIRGTSPEIANKLNALGEPAIALEKEPRRLYPQGAVSAHAVGFVSKDDVGQGGMERAHDAALAAGKQVRLSIKVGVQAALSFELVKAADAYSAKGAAGVILNVRTGEVLAMASVPSFNPNRVDLADPEALRNVGTQSVFELGSTFKPFTIAAAIEYNVERSMTKRFDATVPIRLGKFEIHDDESDAQHRWLNIPETLTYSSNIATARIADEIGATLTCSPEIMPLVS